MDPFLTNLGVHCKDLGVQLIYSQQDQLIFNGALTLVQGEKHANYLLTTDSYSCFSVNSSQISVDTFFLTETTLNLKKWHNLQQSQVTSTRDNDTCAPEINQQGGVKPKFYILCG